MYKRFNLTNNIYVKCIYTSIDLHVAISSIQNYVMKFVSDLRQVGGFSRYFGFRNQYNLWPLYNWNIVEINFKTHSANPIYLFTYMNN